MAACDTVGKEVQTAQAELLFIGDSILRGWQECGKHSWQTFYGRRKTACLLTRGGMTEELVASSTKLGVHASPTKVAVVMTGNDQTLGGESPEQIFQSVQRISRNLRERVPNLKVILVGVILRGEGGDDPLRTIATRANEAIARLSDDQSVFFTDLGARLLTNDGRLNEELMQDARRLRSAGYHTCAEWLEAKITTLLGEMEDPSFPVPLEPAAWNSAWLRRHESFNERVKQGNVGMIFIGDSITNGWVTDGKEIWEQHYSKRNAVNLGTSGDRIQHMLWRIDHGNIDGISPKLAVLMIGTNNSSRSRIEDIPPAIQAVIGRLRAKLPRTKILLLAIFPRGKDNADPWRQVNERVNRVIETFSDGEHVFFLNINDRFINPDGTPKPGLYLDLAHLSAHGYKTWAEAMEPSVRKLMGEA